MKHISCKQLHDKDLGSKCSTTMDISVKVVYILSVKNYYCMGYALHGLWVENGIQLGFTVHVPVHLQSIYITCIVIRNTIIIINASMHRHSCHCMCICFEQTHAHMDPVFLPVHACACPLKLIHVGSPDN